MRDGLRPGRSLPGRSAKRHHPGPDGPVPVANAAEIAEFLRDDTRPLGRTIQLELVVAQYLIRLRDAVTPDAVPIGPAPLLGLIEELDRAGDGLSRAILETVAELTDGEPASKSREAAGRLAARGLQYPARFRAVGSARALEAWAIREAGEACLAIEFEHADGARHAVMAFVVDPSRGGYAKHVAITASMWDLDDDAPFHPSRLEAAPVDLVARELRAALDAADPASGRPASQGDDFRALIAAGRVRAATERGARTAL
jgi:hypothetical protein